MIKSLATGICIVAFTGSLAFAQPSQSQGGGNAGTNGTSDSTQQGTRSNSTTSGSNTMTRPATPTDTPRGGMQNGATTNPAGGGMSK